MNGEIDFKRVESLLLGIGFNAKKYFPVLLKPFQFKTFGFSNQKDCKLLCEQIKLLLEKYPIKRKTKRNKQNNYKKHANDIKFDNSSLERFVQDTNVN